VRISKVALPGLTLRIPTQVGRHATGLTFRAASSLRGVLTIGRNRFKLQRRTRRFTLRVLPGRGPLLLELKLSAGGITTHFAARVAR
jgi:hypothetical protein